MSMSRTEGISRRNVVLVLFGSALSLAGCDSEESAESLRLSLQEEVKQVDDALDELESAVDKFETQDWREVVPEVKDGLAELQTKVKALEGMLIPRQPD